MPKIYTTAKGKQVDMELMRMKNRFKKAVGTPGLNAGGDTIDAKGNVIVTKEQKVAAYNKNSSKAVKAASISDLNPESFLTIQDVAKNAKENAAKKNNKS